MEEMPEMQFTESRGDVSTIGDFSKWLAGLDWDDRGVPPPIRNVSEIFANIDIGELTETDCHVLLWPPDVFAITATILRASAGYLKLSNRWPPSNERMKQLGFVNISTSDSHEILDQYALEMSRMGQKWREAVNESSLYLPDDWAEGLRIEDVSKRERVAKKLRREIAKVHPLPPEPVKELLTKIPKQVLLWWKLLRCLASFHVSLIGVPEESPEFEIDRRVVEGPNADDAAISANKKIQFDVSILAAQVLQLLLAASG